MLKIFRLILALLVWFSHAYTLIGKSWKEPVLIATKGRFGIGTLALDCFMILSGYLLFETYTKRSSFVDYWRRRFLRIYPPYIVSILVTIIIGVFVSSLNVSTYFKNSLLLRYLSNFSFIHQSYILPGVFQNIKHYSHSADGSIWSLPYEFLLYIWVPVLYFFNRKRVVNLLLVFLVSILFFLNYVSLPMFPLFDLNVLVHLCIPFLIGVFLANKIEKKHLIILGSIFILLCVLNSGIILSGSVFILEGVFMYLFFNGLKKTSYLGKYPFPDLSYGVFLYGFFMQQITIDLVNPTSRGFNLYLIVSMLFTISMALFSWYVIEEPFLKIKQKIA